MNCRLCNIERKKTNSHLMLKRALYHKYIDSVEKLYQKLINNYIYGKRSKRLINFRDEIHMTEKEEYLKKYYRGQTKINKKIQDLVNYYMYHIDIPRIYIIPVIQFHNYFHDKKRRLNYYKIKRLIHVQSGNKEPLQITEDNSSTFQNNNTIPSLQFFQNQKMLKTFLLKSINNQQIPKNTLLDIYGEIQQNTRLNLQDVEQQQIQNKIRTQFLFDTQNSIQTIQKIKPEKIKLSQLKEKLKLKEQNEIYSTSCSNKMMTTKSQSKQSLVNNKEEQMISFINQKQHNSDKKEVVRKLSFKKIDNSQSKNKVKLNLDRLSSPQNRKSIQKILDFFSSPQNQNKKQIQNLMDQFSSPQNTKRKQGNQGQFGSPQNTFHKKQNSYQFQDKDEIIRKRSINRQSLHQKKPKEFKINSKLTDLIQKYNGILQQLSDPMSKSQIRHQFNQNIRNI